MTKPGINPENPEVLAQDKPTFVEWYLAQERRLVETADELGFKKLEIIGFDKHPAGNWTHKKLLKSDGQVIARYWLSLRRTGKSKLLRVPRFNLECGEQLGQAFRIVKRDLGSVKLKTT